MTLAKSYSYQNSFIFESALRISLLKLERYRQIPKSKIHDIVCTTNLSNEICAALDKIIQMQDPTYVPKQRLKPPIPMPWEEKVLKPKRKEIVRKRSSLMNVETVFFVNEVDVEAELQRMEARLGPERPKKKGIEITSFFKLKKEPSQVTLVNEPGIVVKQVKSKQDKRKTFGGALLQLKKVTLKHGPRSAPVSRVRQPNLELLREPTPLLKVSPDSESLKTRFEFSAEDEYEEGAELARQSYMQRIPVKQQPSTSSSEDLQSETTLYNNQEEKKVKAAIKEFELPPISTSPNLFGDDMPFGKSVIESFITFGDGVSRDRFTMDVVPPKQPHLTINTRSTSTVKTKEPVVPAEKIKVCSPKKTPNIVLNRTLDAVPPTPLKPEPASPISPIARPRSKTEQAALKKLGIIPSQVFAEPTKSIQPMINESFKPFTTNSLASVPPVPLKPQSVSPISPVRSQTERRNVKNVGIVPSQVVALPTDNETHIAKPLPEPSTNSLGSVPPVPLKPQSGSPVSPFAKARSETERGNVKELGIAPSQVIAQPTESIQPVINESNIPKPIPGPSTNSLASVPPVPLKQQSVSPISPVRSQTERGNVKKVGIVPSQAVAMPADNDSNIPKPLAEPSLNSKPIHSAGKVSASLQSGPPLNPAKAERMASPSVVSVNGVQGPTLNSAKAERMASPSAVSVNSVQSGPTLNSAKAERMPSPSVISVSASVQPIPAPPPEFCSKLRRPPPMSKNVYSGPPPPHFVPAMTPIIVHRPPMQRAHPHSLPSPGYPHPIIPRVQSPTQTTFIDTHIQSPPFIDPQYRPTISPTYSAPIEPIPQPLGVPSWEIREHQRKIVYMKHMQRRSQGQLYYSHSNDQMQDPYRHSYGQYQPKLGRTKHYSMMFRPHTFHMNPHPC